MTNYFSVPGPINNISHSYFYVLLMPGTNTFVSTKACFLMPGVKFLNKQLQFMHNNYNLELKL